MFSLSRNFSYNASSYDAVAKLEDLNVIQYNDEYLAKLKKKLAKDSLNAFLLNNMGNYYNNIGNAGLARKYFTKSFNNLVLKSKTKKDSALYYSFRGLLKANLEKDNAIADIEKALEINPKDSLAISFYPIFLVQNKGYSKVKKICSTVLDDGKNDYQLLAFTFYGMGVIFEELDNLGDESKKIENRSKNYNELFDYKNIEKYATLHKKNIEIQHMKKMLDVLGLTLKMFTFEFDEENNIKTYYTAFEIEKINQLKLDFQELMAKKKLNPYSANKNIAMLNFLLKDYDKAIENAKKAIAAFPDSKSSAHYNPNETYELLSSLYLMKKDEINVEKNIIEKIQKNSDYKKSIADYINMAYIHLYRNELDEAEKWCNKAREIDSDSFDALRLLAHLNSLKGGFENSLVQFYLDQAYRQIKSEEDEYSLGVQSIVYMILINNPNNAKLVYDNVESCKKINPKGTKFLDELVEKYILVTP
ncbi:tetratricopeptide repeat protein [Flavobacterium amniphilum]|uniref:tetratricopeptide repeat protein n=1 Tax=Flavobacterium amniphilum TaxID=1834035 RepID=UPI00202A9D11|nr:hypothetical protein [Flavobacterium amniphilum]